MQKTRSFFGTSAQNKTFNTDGLKHFVDRFNQRAILRTARDKFLNHTPVTYGPGVIFHGSLRVCKSEKLFDINPGLVYIDVSDRVTDA